MSALALSPADREHLAKLLGMLGSDHLGERDNAAQAAHRLVQQHGLTWFDVVVMHRSPPGSDDPDTDPIGGDWRQTATACSKQRSILLKLVVRLRACGCEL